MPISINNTSEERPTAVYNAESQSLIAVFSNRTLAGKFILGKQYKAPAMRVSRAVIAKQTMFPKSTIHSFRIAARNATPQQIKDLGNSHFLLLDDSLRSFLSHIGTTKHFAPISRHA